MENNLRKKLVSFNRKLSWVFTIIAVAILSLGYLMTRIGIDRALYQPIHTYLGYAYAILLVLHFILSLTVIGYPWRSLISDPWKIMEGWTLTRVVQRISAWVLLIGSALMVATGLGWNDEILWNIVSFTPHVQYDVIVSGALALHIVTGLKSALARNRVSLPQSNKVIGILGLLLVITAVYADLGLGRDTTVDLGDTDTVFPEEYTDPENTTPRRQGSFRLGYQFSGSTQVYRFNPEEVNTTRPDIFKPGYFSVFDVLVHVAEKGEIDLEYHFDENLNTHVIDKMNGEREWWYEIYFSGGWPESNFYRMDHWPWKDGASLTFFPTTPERVDERHTIFRDEMIRLEENDGKVIIPDVYISGIYDRWQYTDVEVTAHNVRSDMYQPGVITALDVILSIGDTGEMNYTLQWYEQIGTADIVKSYWVESINGDAAEGRCGFVHEEGSITRLDRGGNHIHLPSDIKVLNSPEYAWWFYICI